MDIVQLKYFKAVAQTEHLTNAAKQLNVAQPALSVSISRLENEIGQPATLPVRNGTWHVSRVGRSGAYNFGTGAE